jgi:uncharacterized repeat protein (TIGR03803 family)
MKACTKNRFYLPVLIAALGLVLPSQAGAQTFTTLHSFGGGEGATPYGGLILSAKALYGTASAGGPSGHGTVFKINTDGTGFTTLYDFPTNIDGVGPQGDLVLSGNTLYGTAAGGGSAGNGTVFSVSADGTGFRTLHSFTGPVFNGRNPITNNDGALPNGGLTLSDNILYGTAAQGGSGGNGTVFSVNTDGTGFKTLHSFSTSDPVTGTSTDGAWPRAGLILSSNALYGTASLGGSSSGTIFKLNTDGTGFTILHNFTGGLFSPTDGGYPTAKLTLSGGTLYGTTEWGGNGGVGSTDIGGGTLFALSTDGTGFRTLQNFTDLVTNIDGAFPEASLILSGNTLYGTASLGGSSANGTVFEIHTDGTGFRTLHSFTSTGLVLPGQPLPPHGTNTDGAEPLAGLILSGNTLYGTAFLGGSGDNGTVFSIAVPPELTITIGGANLSLTWPTNFIDFALQSTTNLGSSAIWATNSSAPVVVNGQNTVTNPNSAARRFFRLAR